MTHHTEPPEVTPMKNRFSDAPNVRSVLFQAIGAGSTCWHGDPGDLVFDAEEAGRVCVEAMARISEILGPRGAVKDDPPVPERWRRSCWNCGAKLMPPGATACRACGAKQDVPSRPGFCRACGDPLTDSECSHCGATYETPERYRHSTEVEMDQEELTVISTLDLYEHYLTSPLSEARFRDATLTFVVNGYVYDGFCDLAERLGWELVESRELAEETYGGWANVTIRRKPTPPSFAPFVPADPTACTCVNPFSNCPTHG